MKHAVLVGVPSEGPQGLNPSPSLSAMTQLLADLGGWNEVVVSGESASREEVLAALEAMISTSQPGDVCLFYFFGHGGVVRFSELTGDLAKRPVFYLATLRRAGTPMVGVLDFELSAALTRLDRICGNVTAIVDSCHAAPIVREGDIPVIAPPPWVTSLAEREQARSHRLAAEGHPRIVRLFGSSALRSAYAQCSPEGHYGRLTREFVAVLREAALRCDRLTWDSVAHRVREQTSQALGTEDQRIVLAGPRQRLVFSTQTTALPRSAAFLPRGDSDRGWIRAGLLQGIEPGDRWSLAALTLGDDLLPRFVADTRVLRVELDRSEVSIVTAPSVEVSAGTTAIHQGFERPERVAVDASSTITAIINASELLEVVPIDATSVIARVRESTHTSTTRRCLDVSDGNDRSIRRLPLPDDTSSNTLLGLLEDRARAQRLLTSLERNTETAVPDPALSWRWGRMGKKGELIEILAGTCRKEAPQLYVGDRLWIELRHRGSPPPHWFVSVLQLGVEGRPRVLNVSEPEGMEVAPGPPVCVGRRGHRRHPGLPLFWPPGVATQDALPSALVMIASHRPISLGHIVHEHHPEDPEAFIVQGLGLDSIDTARSDAAKPPEASPAWSWERIDFMLVPHRRDRPMPSYQR